MVGVVGRQRVQHHVRCWGTDAVAHVRRLRRDLRRRGHAVCCLQRRLCAPVDVVVQCERVLQRVCSGSAESVALVCWLRRQLRGRAVAEATVLHDTGARLVSMGARRCGTQRRVPGVVHRPAHAHLYWLRGPVLHGE